MKIFWASCFLNEKIILPDGQFFPSQKNVPFVCALERGKIWGSSSNQDWKLGLISLILTKKKGEIILV